jgi:hypothetical protein
VMKLSTRECASFHPARLDDSEFVSAARDGESEKNRKAHMSSLQVVKDR